jgi:hypothetical protein
MNVEIKLTQFFSVLLNQEQEIDDRWTFLLGANSLILPQSSHLTRHISLVAGSNDLWNSQCWRSLKGTCEENCPQSLLMFSVNIYISEVPVIWRAPPKEYYSFPLALRRVSKLQKRLLALSYLLVCLPACNNLAVTGPTSMIFETWVFFENLSRKFKAY